MKTTAIITALLSTTAALAAPLESRQSSSTTTYGIKSFTTRKYDGQNINTVFFNITATNGGTLDFTCSAYDPALGYATDSFESGKVYFCGENSLFSFSYTPEAAEGVDTLFIWQDVSGTVTLGGSATPPEGICRAGGNGVDDLICVVPEQGDFTIEMRDLNA